MAVTSVVVLMSTSAGAAPNGLTQIPIAKVYGDGVAAFSISRSDLSAQSATYTTQYGIDNRLEVGVDYQSAPADQRTFLGNAKYLVADNPGRLPDIAVGMTNVASGQRAVPYAVATTQPRATGMSLGSIRSTTSHAYEGMAGVSYNVTPTLQVVSDYIEGGDAYGTVGIIANLTPAITVNAAYCRPNSSDSPRGYAFNIAYTFHLISHESNRPSGQSKVSASR